jgi:hypothetical protein
MGKKFLIASVIIVAILFGAIFWKVNESDQIDDTYKNVSKTELASIDKKVETDKTVPIVPPTKAQKQNLSELDTLQAVEQIVPAAFGFLQQKETLQVVGLLSKNDKTGSLMAYIDQLCQKRTCSVDVSYRADIIDADWQEDVVGILKLFIEEGVSHGSLFIQANSISLEGNVTDANSTFALQTYLAHLEKEGLKVHDHSTGNTITAEPEAKTYVEETNATVPLKKEMKINSDLEREDISAVKPALKLENRQPKQKSTPSEVQGKKFVQKKIPKKKIKKLHLKKNRLKKVRVVRQKSEEDIIAPSYMETSIDLERKIKSKIDRKQKSMDSLEDEDIVAKPHLEILR